MIRRLAVTVNLTTDGIMARLKELYRSAPDIHVSISTTRPKLHVERAEAKLTGVYPHIFRLAIKGECGIQYYSHPYTDVLVGKVKIEEL